MLGLLPDLRARNTTDREEMESADADLETLLRTIRQFRLINLLFSSSRRILRRYVFSVMEQEPNRVYSLLDVGAGGGDIARWAAREARRRRLNLRITALDNDPRILPLAREAAHDYPEVRVVRGDALDLGSLEDFDFIFSNHLMHHLSWDEIESLLKGIIGRARIGFVMNDLKRSRWAYIGAALGIGLLAHRSFALRDGLLSIRRGFRPEELRDFVQNRFPDVPIRVLESAPAHVVLVLPARRNPQGRPL